jgi:hypothetical protein
MLADQSLSFFRLFGDSNGDDKVDVTDFAVFLRALGAIHGSAKYAQYWYFDYGDNGIIDISDLTQFFFDYSLPSHAPCNYQ